MMCPKCHNPNTNVYDSRITRVGRAVRRRRECGKCGNRFTTLEEVKILDLYVEKRNGQTELFSEEKLEKGITKAYNKRRIDQEKIGHLVQKITEDILTTGKNPIKSTRIGKIVLKNLKHSDEAAYICYWAMYGNFDSAVSFNKLLKEFEAED